MTTRMRPSFMVDERFTEAIGYAGHWHRFHYRKSTSTPYFCHPLGAASLVIEAGGDEDQAIGALLHDIAEDCGGEIRLTEIRVMFGERVEAIVRGCSDSLTEEDGEKAPWRERKESHLAHLREASSDVLIVSAADKVHNARAIATDLAIEGEAVWDRFNADRESILWYYNEMLDIFIQRAVAPSLITPLRNAIAVMSA